MLWDYSSAIETSPIHINMHKYIYEINMLEYVIHNTNILVFLLDMSCIYKGIVMVDFMC